MISFRKAHPPGDPPSPGGYPPGDTPGAPRGDPRGVTPQRTQLPTNGGLVNGGRKKPDKKIKKRKPDLQEGNV